MKRKYYSKCVDYVLIFHVKNMEIMLRNFETVLKININNKIMEVPIIGDNQFWNTIQIRGMSRINTYSLIIS